MKMYSISLRNGKVLKATGNLVLFNSSSLNLQPVDNAVYVNVEDVTCIVEIDPNAKVAK